MTTGHAQEEDDGLDLAGMLPAKQTACRWYRSFHDHLGKEKTVHHVEDSPNIPEEMRGRQRKDAIHTFRIIAHASR